MTITDAPDSGISELLSAFAETDGCPPYVRIECRNITESRILTYDKLARNFDDCLFQIGKPPLRYDNECSPFRTAFFDVEVVILDNIEVFGTAGLEFVQRAVGAATRTERSKGKCVVVSAGPSWEKLSGGIASQALLLNPIRMDRVSKSQFCRVLARNGLGYLVNQKNESGEGFVTLALQRTTGKWGLLNRLIDLLPTNPASVGEAFDMLDILPPAPLNIKRSFGPSRPPEELMVHRLVPTSGLSHRNL